MNEDRKQAMSKLQKAEGVQEILDVADDLLGGCPIILIDIRYKLIANSKSRGDKDPLWLELTTKGQFSQESVDFFKNANFIQAYVDSQVALMTAEGMRDRVSVTLFEKSGAQIGSYCIVAYDRDFVEEDFILAELVGERLSEALEKESERYQLPTPKEEGVLVDLIEGRLERSAENDEKIRTLNLRLKEHIYVAVVDTLQYDSTATHFVYFADLFKRIERRFDYFVYLNAVVVIFSTDQVVLNVEKEMKKLSSFFAKNKMYAGVSSSMNSLYELNHYFKQALNALNYGMNLNANRSIFSYEIFKSELFVNTLIDHTRVEELCHPILNRIRDYDKRNKTDYLEFLNSYFINGLNLRPTAKAFGMSVKDAGLRQKTAAALFDIDFTDGNMLFSIFRSIKMHKCFSE